MVGINMVEEPLRRVETEEQARRLLQALSKDMPHSVHVMSVVETVFEFKRTGLLEDAVRPVLSPAVYRYADDGDSSDGDATVVTVAEIGPHFVAVCLHTTDATGAALRRTLADSALLPWDGEIHFDSVHERCVPALLHEVRARGDCRPEVHHTDKVYLPKEDALKLHASCPPGYVLLPLQAKHDVAALETWAGRVWLGALDLIRSVIVRNPGLSWGAFPEDKTEGYPAAHILGEGGFLRILYTSDDHRRKGLGGLVTRAACRALAERVKDLHANIVFPNPASEATFRKLGFKRICECTFVVYNPSRPDHPPADAPVVKF